MNNTNLVLGQRSNLQTPEEVGVLVMQPNVLQLNYSENEANNCGTDFRALILELTSYLNPTNMPRKPITITMSNGVCLKDIYLTEVIGNPACGCTKIIVKFFTQHNMQANKWRASEV